MQRDEVDLLEIGSYWSDRNLRMLEACRRDRAAVPAERSLDVVFEEFMADDLAMVERIYARAGQPLDDAARTAHRSYLAAHQRDRHGKVVYEPERFGLDLPGLRAAFRPYTDQFSVPEEWPTGGGNPAGTR
jgi:hypothetical protein